MDPEQARLRYLEQSKHLSDREKDEVDVRARLIIKTCRDRVELLERREKRMSHLWSMNVADRGL
jgi:syntaxin 18